MPHYDPANDHTGDIEIDERLSELETVGKRPTCEQCGKDLVSLAEAHAFSEHPEYAEKHCIPTSERTSPIIYTADDEDRRYICGDPCLWDLVSDELRVRPTHPLKSLSTLFAFYEGFEAIYGEEDPNRESDEVVAWRREIMNSFESISDEARASIDDRHL